jgi:hypothetical protein
MRTDPEPNAARQLLYQPLPLDTLLSRSQSYGPPMGTMCCTGFCSASLASQQFCYGRCPPPASSCRGRPTADLDRTVSFGGD